MLMLIHRTCMLCAVPTGVLPMHVDTVGLYVHVQYMYYSSTDPFMHNHTTDRGQSNVLQLLKLLSAASHVCQMRYDVASQYTFWVRRFLYISHSTCTSSLLRLGAGSVLLHGARCDKCMPRHSLYRAAVYFVGCCFTYFV